MAKKRNTTDDTKELIAAHDEMDPNFSAFNIRKAIIEVINTGSPLLNEAIGIDGYPRGRIIHIYGPNGSGKTFLAMVAIAELLKADPTAEVIWFDVEHSFNVEWAQKLGIFDNIRVIKNERGKVIFEKIVGKIVKKQHGTEKVRDGILDFVKRGEKNIPLIVIDSLADIICPKEEAAPVGGLTVAALPGFLTAELKRVSGLLEESNTSLLCLNQVRQNLDPDVIRRQGPYHFPGGENLSHKMSLNILVERMTNMESLILLEPKNYNSLIGQKVRLTVKKSRFGPAPRMCETTFLFQEGAGYNKIGIVDTDLEIIEIAIKYGIVVQGGAWYTLPNGEKFQGVAKVRDYLSDKPEMLQELLDKAKAAKYSAVPVLIEKEKAAPKTTFDDVLSAEDNDDSNEEVN